MTLSAKLLLKADGICMIPNYRKTDLFPQHSTQMKTRQKDIELVGEFKATTEAKTEKSEAFNMELKYFEGTVTFVQRVKLKKDKAKLVGYVEYMSCSGGQCIPPAEEEFEFELTK